MSSVLSMPTNKTKVRDSNIELLRILAIMGVVVLHYNNWNIGGGLRYVEAGSVNQTVLIILESVFICAVNLFMLITGFFSCTSQKRNLSKVLMLLLQVSVFRMIRYLKTTGEVISGSGFLLILLPVNYFVILYTAVYLISPYVNLILNKLNKKEIMKFLGLCIFLFSFCPTIVDVIKSTTGAKNGLSTISMYGDDRGYTFVNFLLMYMIGAGLRLLNIKVKKRYAAIIFFCCVLLLSIWGSFNSSIAWSYCNPIVILEAIAIFLFFRQIDLKSKLVNNLSKSTFTCFLFHNIILDKYGISSAVGGTVIYMISHIVFTCVTIYLISFFVFQIWNVVSKPIEKLLNNIFKKVKFDFTVNL